MRSLFGEMGFISMWIFVKMRNEAGQTFNIHCQVQLHPHNLFLETSAGAEQVLLFRPSFCLKFKGHLLLFGESKEYTFQEYTFGERRVYISKRATCAPFKTQQFQQQETLTFFSYVSTDLVTTTHSFQKKKILSIHWAPTICYWHWECKLRCGICDILYLKQYILCGTRHTIMYITSWKW